MFLLKKLGSIRHITTVLCLILLLFSIFQYLAFREFLYITIIELGNEKIAVQESYFMHYYSCDFYKIKYRLFKQPIENSPHFSYKYPAFHKGDYDIVSFDGTEVIIEYKDPRYDALQQLTVHY